MRTLNKASWGGKLSVGKGMKIRLPREIFRLAGVFIKSAFAGFFRGKTQFFKKSLKSVLTCEAKLDCIGTFRPIRSGEALRFLNKKAAHFKRGFEKFFFTFSRPRFNFFRKIKKEVDAGRKTCLSGFFPPETGDGPRFVKNEKRRALNGVTQNQSVL